MPDQAISQQLRAFIGEHIDSVLQLEILLLLHDRPQSKWTAAEISKELRIDAAWTEDQLTNLRAHGLLQSAEGPPRSYQYGPAVRQMEQLVGELARAYADRRVTVIGLIYSKPLDKIRSFADAFRIRKEKPDG